MRLAYHKVRPFLAQPEISPVLESLPYLILLHSNSLQAASS